MARQIIDLRTEEQKKGVTGLQKTSQVFADILTTLGKVEGIRRERQQLDNVARSIAAGATTTEAILAAANKPAETAGGIQGILQNIGGAFQPPQAGGTRRSIQQSIIGSALQKSLSPKEPSLLTREERREKALFGTRKRAGAAAIAAPTEQQKQRDRDLKIIGNEQASEFQKKEARARIDADPSQPREPVPTGGKFDEFLNDNDKENGKFGKKAHDAALKKVEDEARLQGLDPTGVKDDFERWWDERVENERTGLFGGGFTRNVTVPRAEFQNLLQRGEPEQPQILTPPGRKKVKATPLTPREPGEAIAEFLKRTGK